MKTALAPSSISEKTMVPFNRPSLVGTEHRYLQEAIESGHISGDGPFTIRCQQLLSHLLGIQNVLLTTSCTHALEMSALLLNIRPGDEVIVPSFTFVSTANAFVLLGATPVFIDIRPDTLNLDESQLREKMTPRTKAVVCVHYGGVGCEMNEICQLASSQGIGVVEDNAHGLFGRYRGKLLGTFGHLATQSFHETKNFSCGEGGALLLNDSSLMERAEIIREKGTNRKRFFQGQVDKYSWVDVGSSYLPSDLLAAYLYAQLEARDQIQRARARLWRRYQVALDAWAAERDIQLPYAPEHCEHPYHVFYLLMPSLESRQRLIAFLKARGILAVFHYLPLHLSEMGRRFGGQAGDCPVTENISDRLVRLPLYNSMSESEQEYVIETVLRFY